MTQPTPQPLALGTRTQWGKIAAVGITGGERYYWMTKAGVVSMMPADVVEPAVHDPQEPR